MFQSSGPSIAVLPLANLSGDPQQDYLAAAAEVAAKLGVRCVLEGSVRRSSGHLRIALQLNDVTGDTQLWGEYYELSVEAGPYLSWRRPVPPRHRTNACAG